MDDSYLSSDDEKPIEQGESEVSIPSIKMYNIELPFLVCFKKELQKIQAATQNLLLELTKVRETHSDKKRLPYSVFRAFQKQFKYIRILRLKITQDNKIYTCYLASRDQRKAVKNMLFKRYLKQLGNKRQEMKLYINRVETRVRLLEDNGYAQFVDYDILVPEMNTIRFTFQPEILLQMVDKREMYRKITIQELKKRIALVQKIKQAIQIDKQVKKAPKSQIILKGQEIVTGDGINQPSFALLTCTDLSPSNCIQHFITYNYFCNDQFIRLELPKISQNKKKLIIQIEYLKKSLKSTEQLIFKTKIRNGVLAEDPKFTRTDHLILFRQMQNQIRDKISNHIFEYQCKLKKNRSKSWSGIKTKV